MENYIEYLNFDCMLALFKFMDWSDILSFGLTNKKNYIFVKYYIQLKHGSVKLNFDQTQNLANIFIFYGNCFKSLNLNFHKIAPVFKDLNMPTLEEENESFHLHLWLSFPRHANNFLNDYFVALNTLIKLINNSRFTQLQHFQINFHIHRYKPTICFTIGTGNDFLFQRFDKCNERFFTHLKHFNMVTHNVKYKAEKVILTVTLFK